MIQTMGARLVKMPMNLEELATLNTIGFFVVFFIFIICLFRCLPYVPRMEGGSAIQITPKSTFQKCPEHIGEKFCCFCFIKISTALLSYYCLVQLQFIFLNLTLTLYTAKTVYRNFETNIPGNETARPQSQFQHSCFCERFIYSHDQSAYSAAGI